MFFNEFLENCLNRFLFHLLDIYLKFLVNFVLFPYSVTEFYLECCFYFITCRTCCILKTVSTSESKLDFDMKIILKRKKIALNGTSQPKKNRPPLCTYMK